MRERGSGGGTRRDFMIGALLLLPLCCPARFKLTGGFHLILRLGPFLTMTAGLVVSLSLFVSLLSGLSRGS